MMVEMNQRQTANALKLFGQAKGYEKGTRVKDYSHRYRVVTARRINERAPVN